MSLRELQERFQLQMLRGGASLEELIAERPPLTPSQRLAIYRNAYGARLTDALRANYPKLHLVLGDEVFAAAAAGFIAARPSTTRSIRWFGAQLADHLARTAPFCTQPALAELARFEWALTESFDAADSPVLSREDLARTAAPDWGSLRFSFQPSLRTLNLAWNVVEIWKALDAAPEAAAPLPVKSAEALTWVIWRQQFQNRFRSIGPAEATALAWATDGASFGDICEQLARLIPPDEVPATAATLLANWLDSGMMAGYLP